VTVTELHARLAELLGEHGSEEVALNHPNSQQLYKVASVTPYETTGNPHGWPSFVRVGDELWDDAEWRK